MFIFQTTKSYRSLVWFFRERKLQKECLTVQPPKSLFQSKTKVPKYFWKLIMMCHPKLYSDCAYKSQLWIKLLLCSMQCKENMIGKHRFSFYKSQQMVRLLQLVLEIYAWIKWNSSSLSFAAYNHCCIISCCFVLYPETKTNLWRTVPQGTLL